MLRLDLSQEEQKDLDKVYEYYTPLLNEVFDKITSAMVAWNNMELKSPTSNFHINILKLAVSDAKISLKVA